MQLKDVISGRGQGLLRFNQFVYKQLKPEQLKEPIAMYDCGQHLSNSQL